ncbi:MAG: magnesium transporter [Candidatus Lokiarchaeota archaeon]
MDTKQSKWRIAKETFPSESISIIGSIFAGLILSLLILQFKSFSVLILMVPALLSLRGNISSPFIARTARDLIIGDFNLKSWLQNVFASYSLSIVTAIFIGLFSILFRLIFLLPLILPLFKFILIPVISLTLTLSITVPTSTLLNYIVFKFGLNPNNVVNPVMSAVGDFSNIVMFYLTLILLGVP